MNKLKIEFLRVFFLLSIFLLSTNFISAQVAVKAEMIYTMAGNILENGIILCENGKITEIGKADEISIPPDYQIVEGKIVTPGLIDAHSVVGLAGIYNRDQDQDQLEKSDPIQPELRAIDAFNPKEKLVSWLSSFGVTTINTGHAPGALSSGQTMVVKTDGNFNESIIDTTSAVVFSLGTEVAKVFKSPGTRPKGIAMLRNALYKAEDYKKKMKKGDTPKNLKNEAFLLVLDKKVPAIITANTAVDILGAIRLAKEFNFDLILDGAAESYLVIKEIKAAGIPIILHPMMARTKNISYETPKLLAENGIVFAIQSGYESYVPKTRNVLFEAAIAASNGLTFEEALAAITISPSKILKIDSNVGSIEVGKDADIVVFDEDPFEYTSHVCSVILNGKIVHTGCK
ncbi:N-acetyl-L,L-diaminopimelate deacetylase [hydrothermal vent metagenome]|uniref:N-acetyl-L,L-diaminopimelate deacetylase n=1 Tax=hydrothermal vent metagenome TaxID=652676 RepID=A0A3B1CTE0_9ZZZZ